MSSMNPSNPGAAGPNSFPAAAMAHLTSDPEYKELEETLQKAIVEDPRIADQGKVSAYIKREGGKVVIHLIGKIGTKGEKNRAGEIADEHRKEEYQVSNEIVVE